MNAFLTPLLLSLGLVALTGAGGHERGGGHFPRGGEQASEVSRERGGDRAIDLPRERGGPRWQRGEERSVYQATREGAVRPLHEIEGGVVPDMRRRGATYLGPEFDPNSGSYRLKFVRGGSVIWVDVDGRTGEEIGRSGR